MFFGKKKIELEFETYFEERKIKIEGGWLDFKSISKKVLINFSVKKRYKKFENLDDILFMVLKISDSEGRVWQTAIEQSSSDIWNMTPDERTYFTPNQKTDRAIAKLNGLLESRTYNQLIVDMKIVELYEKYLEYELSIFNFTSKNADGKSNNSNELTVELRFKNKEKLHIAYNIYLNQLLKVNALGGPAIFKRTEETGIPQKDVVFIPK